MADLEENRDSGSKAQPQATTADTINHAPGMLSMGTAQYGPTGMRRKLNLRRARQGAHTGPNEREPPASESHEPLDAGKAEHFGQRLGADLRAVTIHSGDGIAEERGAAAVTFGKDIHFAQAAPKGAQRDSLLGHELVHCVQQGAVPRTHRAGHAPDTGEGDAAAADTEAEAEQLGHAAARGHAGAVRLQAASAAQKQPKLPPAGTEEEREDSTSPPRAAVTSAAPARPAPPTARKAQPERDAATLARDASPGKAPAGDASPGRAPMGDASPGKAPAGDASPGKAPAGDAAPGKTPAGDAAPGKTPAQGAPTGAAPAAAARAAAHRTSALMPRADHHAAPSAGRAQGLPAQASRAPLSTPTVPAPQGPSADLALAIAHDGSQTAAAIRARAAVVTAALRTAAGHGASHVREQATAGAARIEERHATTAAGVTTHSQQASAAVEANHQAAAGALFADAQAQQGRVRQEGERQSSVVPQEAAQQRAAVEGAAQAGTARFQEGSQARVQQASAAVAGGSECADAQAEASEKAGAQAAQTFSQDEVKVQTSLADGASRFGATIEQHVSGFLAAIGQTIPQVLSGMSEHMTGASTGLSRAAREASAALTTLSAEARQHMAGQAQAAAHELTQGGATAGAAIIAHADETVDQVQQKSEELATTVEQQAHAAATALAATPRERAAALGAEVRGQLDQARGLADTELTGVSAQVGAGIAQRAQACSDALSSDAGAAAGQVQELGAQAAGRIAHIHHAAGPLLQSAAQTAGGQLLQVADQAISELGQGGAQVAGHLQGAGAAAQSELQASADKAAGDQQGNLGLLESKKQAAASDIGARYSALKSEGESKSDAAQKQSAQQGGQNFLDLLLPKSWTEAVKGWFKSTFGAVVGGIIYGLLSSLVGLGIAAGLVALGALIGGPIGAAVVLGILLVGGAALGIYGRFSSFAANNGRSPGLGEGTLLVLLGIADITGVPQIVEGIAGQRAFSNGHRLEDFERAEMITSGLVQVVAIFLALRGAKGPPKPVDTSIPEVKPPEVKPPEVNPPEVKPPEVKPPEAKPPEVEPLPPARELGLRQPALDAIEKMENIKKDPVGEVNSIPDKNHYNAARREALGEVVARKSDGRPFDHIRDLQEAHNGLDDVRLRLEAEMRNPPDTMTERGMKVLLQKHAEVQALLSRLKGFLSSIGHGPPFPPFHQWPPGS